LFATIFLFAHYSFVCSTSRAVDRTKTPWVIAMFHTPWYTSNAHHPMSEGTAMREAMELDDACCVTFEGLRSENARLNGMLLLERDRDEVNRAKHGDILRAKAREADTARAASEAREEALDARLAKLRDSIVRATALVAEKDALRATNAQRHDVNADMAALIRSGSVCVHRVPSCTLTPPPSHTPLTPPPSLLPSTKPAGTLLTS
jgi:hypothetical protein